MDTRHLSPAITSMLSAFSFSASEPYTDHTAVTPMRDSTACTVRLNQYDDGAPIDTRYIGTAHAEAVKYPGFTHSGITYTQHQDINGTAPGTTNVSFQAEANLHNWRMPDGDYYQSYSQMAQNWPDSEAESIKPLTFAVTLWGVEGTLYDSRYTNWTRSAEIDIENPATCLQVRNALEGPLPTFNAFNNFGGENSNGYAERIWSRTGFPTNMDTLSNTQGVTMLNRGDLIAEQIKSGALSPQPPADIPPPWKPY